MKKAVVILLVLTVVSLGLFVLPASGNTGCPPGWGFQFALGASDPYDNNGDGLICTKDIPGSGNGNSGQRAESEEVGHVPGHNHKDNNNP